MNFEVKEFYHEIWLSEIGDKPAIISTKLIYEIKEILKNIKDSVKPLVIWAPSGIAGANIKEMVSMTKSEASAFSKLGNSLIDEVKKYSGAVLLGADRYLLGGGFEFALATDIRIVTKECKYGFPEVSLGIIPGFGGIELTYYRCNKKANELYLLGEIKKASNNDYDAFHYIEDDFANVQSKIEKIINRINGISKIALSEAKKQASAIEKNTNEPIEKVFSRLFEEYDQKEGMNAFLEKRKPAF